MTDNIQKSKIRDVRGKTGEEAVCSYLRELGYSITARNYRKKCGEIDIIAENDDFIVFVEVKTRKFGSLVQGADAVTKQKQKKIILTADLYISETGTLKQPRYDIAEVVITTDKYPDVLEINYYENDFDSSGIFTWN